MVKLDGSAFEELGRVLAEEPPPPPPKKKKRKAGDDDGWRPILTPKQQEAFDSSARYILCDGEKGSGKTIGLLHKLVRHCYENDNALGLILVRVKSMATKGGAWDKLNNHILPRWKQGNRDREGNILDEGLGLEYSDVKMDAQHNEYIWIENAHGGWSMIVLISAPHAHQLRERIRGYEPSFVLVDELTSCDSILYLQAVAAQVGRREGIQGPQQYTAACNPEGPSHWVYKVWFEDAFDPTTGIWDKDYHRIHVPIEDNKPNLPDGYVENLIKLYKNDPIEAARMLRGEWIERPSGESLFRDIFIANMHVRPSPTSMERILPEPDFPMIIGMDPGSANNAFSFMQWLPTDGALKWVIFDEIVFTQRLIRYPVLVPALLRRVAWWNAYTFGVKKGEPGKRFRVAWNSDNSAFNQFRAAAGSYDVLEFQKLANNPRPNGQQSLVKELGLAPMNVTQAPKFKGSVPARVRLVSEILAGEQLVVSTGCPAHVAMFTKLESEKGPPGAPYDPEAAQTPKRSIHVHPFDSMSYPMMTASINPRLLTPPPEDESSQQMFRIGS